MTIVAVGLHPGRRRRSDVVRQNCVWACERLDGPAAKRLFCSDMEFGVNKVTFPLAGCCMVVLAARVIDPSARVCEYAPRDAYMTDVMPAESAPASGSGSLSIRSDTLSDPLRRWR